MLDPSSNLSGHHSATPIQPPLDSRRARVGIEEELVLIAGLDSIHRQGGRIKPGEVRSEAESVLPALQDSASPQSVSVTKEVTHSVIEVRTPPIAPRSVQAHLVRTGPGGMPVLTQRNMMLAPLPSVLWYPHRRGGRGFTTSDDPSYVEFVKIVTTPDQRDYLGLCGMHVHVSLDGKLDPERALKITRRMRPFLPWLLALAGSSTTDGNGQFNAVASQRWLKWSSLKTSTYGDMGVTVGDYDQRIRRIAKLADLNPDDPAALHRIFAPIRPNFDLGTVEIRMLDVLRSPTERRLLPMLLAALVQAVDELPGNCPLDKEIGTDDFRTAMLTAAESGLYPRSGTMFHPFDGELHDKDVVSRGILQFIADSLTDQGTQAEVSRDFDAVRKHGGGAIRQWQDISYVHNRFKLGGVRSSDYDLEDMRSGEKRIPPPEARAIHLVTAIGSQFELTLEGRRARSEAIYNLVTTLVDYERTRRFETDDLGTTAFAPHP